MTSLARRSTGSSTLALPAAGRGTIRLFAPRSPSVVPPNKRAGGWRGVGSSGRGARGAGVIRATLTLSGGGPADVDVVAGDSWRGGG